jgi:hypothetical protein
MLEISKWLLVLRPGVLRTAYPIPFGGVRQAIARSRTRGEAALKELIRMTAEAEVDMSYFSSRVISTYGAATNSTSGAAATFETEDT